MINSAPRMCVCTPWSGFGVIIMVNIRVKTPTFEAVIRVRDRHIAPGSAKCGAHIADLFRFRLRSRISHHWNRLWEPRLRPEKVVSLIYCRIFFINVSNSGPKSGFAPSFYSRNELNWWNLYFHVLCILDVFGNLGKSECKSRALARSQVEMCVKCGHLRPPMCAKLFSTIIDEVRHLIGRGIDVEIDEFGDQKSDRPQICDDEDDRWNCWNCRSFDEIGFLRIYEWKSTKNGHF